MASATRTSWAPTCTGRFWRRIPKWPTICSLARSSAARRGRALPLPRSRPSTTLWKQARTRRSASASAHDSSGLLRTVASAVRAEALRYAKKMPRSRLYASCGSARANRAQPRQRSSSMSIPKTELASEGVTTGAAIGGKRSVVVVQASARRFSVHRFFGDRVRQDPAKGRLRCGEAFALLEPCVICADGLLAHDAIPCWRFASPLRIRCGVLNRAPAHCRVDFLCPPSSPTPDGSRVSFVCLRLAS